MSTIINQRWDKYKIIAFSTFNFYNNLFTWPVILKRVCCNHFFVVQLERYCGENVIKIPVKSQDRDTIGISIIHDCPFVHM